MNRRRLIKMLAHGACAALGLAMLGVQPVWAQAYPTHPVSINVAYPAGGYTLLMVPNTFAIAPLVLKGGVKMDVIADFAPIIKIGATLHTTPGAIAGCLGTGKLIPLAASEPQRSPVLPDVPTFAGLGYPDIEFTSWWGVLGPKGLPDDIVAKLNAALNEILKMPDVVASMKDIGAVPVGGAPARLADAIANDYDRFGKVVNEFGFQAD